MKRLNTALAAAVTICMSGTVLAADPHGLSVEFKVKPLGTRADFETSLTIDYPVGVSLAKIDSALHSASTLEAMSTLVTKVEISAPNAQGFYTVKTRGTTEFMGFEINRWTHSRCKTERAQGSVTQNCTLSTSGGDTSDFFDHGGSRNTCWENGGRVRCVHQGWGRVKEVKKAWKVLRTAPRMATGGAAQLIADFSTLALILNNTVFASSAVQNLDAWTLKERLYTDGRAYIEDDHLSSGKWMVIKGANDGSFNLTEE